MSYIRSFSNPEGLYIYSLPYGRVEFIENRICVGTIPTHIFNGLLERWWCKSDNENVKYRGASLTFDCKSFIWTLSFSKGFISDILMHEVTLYYIASKYVERKFY